MRRDCWLTLLAAGAALAWGLSGPLVPQAEAADLTIKLGWTSSAGETGPLRHRRPGLQAGASRRSPRAGSRCSCSPTGRSATRSRCSRACGSARSMPAIITNAVVAQIEPAFQINDMPFLYSDEAQAQKVLDGPVGDKLRKKLETKGVVLLGFMEGGFRTMINNVRPVLDARGRQGREVPGHAEPGLYRMFSSLGGNAVPMAWAETFTAVQQGAIDGLGDPADGHRPEQALRGDEVPVADEPHLFGDRAADVEARLRQAAGRPEEGDRQGRRGSDQGSSARLAGGVAKEVVATLESKAA